MAIHNIMTLLFMCVLVNFNAVTSQVVPVHFPMDNVKSYKGERTVCALANSGDIHLRPLFSTVDARSQMDCLRKCFNVSECETVLFNNSKSCLLLGPPGDVIVNDVDLRGDSCCVIYLNPCYNGGIFSNSVCQCPKSYTGQYCQLVNDDRCNYHFDIIHGFDENFNMNDLAALKDLLSPNFKIAFVKDDSSFYTTGPAQYLLYKSTTGIWAAEVQNIISKSTLSSFEPFPKFSGYVMSHTGLVHEASVHFDGTLVSTQTVAALGTYVLARVPVSEYVVMKNGVHGTVDDVIEAILSGYEPMNVAAMTFQKTSKQVIKHRASTELGTRSSTSIISPVYYYNDKIDLDGNKGVYRQFMNGNSNYESKRNVYKDIVFDPCWFDATTDIRNPQTDKNIKYLKTALGSGKRARVVFDGISARTVATYVTKDYVLFQVSPYLSPRDTTLMDSTTDVVHSVVTTDGRVKTCAHRMLNSTSTGQSEYVTDDVRWFVDSRTWKLVYETDLDGLSLKGDLEKLHYDVTSGVDVQIVVETPSLTFSFPGGWMTTDPWAASDSQHDVSAEVKDLLQLWVNDTDFGFLETEYCTFSSVLVSSNLGWRALSYKYSNPIDFNTYTLDAPYGNIKWFVSGRNEE